MNIHRLFIPASALLMAWTTWGAFQTMQAYSWPQALILISVHYPLCLFGACVALVRFALPVRVFAFVFAGLNALLMGGANHG